MDYAMVTKGQADRAIGHFAECKRWANKATADLEEMGAALSMMDSPAYPNDLMRRIREYGDIHGRRK